MLKESTTDFSHGLKAGALDQLLAERESREYLRLVPRGDGQCYPLARARSRSPTRRRSRIESDGIRRRTRHRDAPRARAGTPTRREGTARRPRRSDRSPRPTPRSRRRARRGGGDVHVHIAVARIVVPNGLPPRRGRCPPRRGRRVPPPRRQARVLLIRQGWVHRGGRSERRTIAQGVHVLTGEPVQHTGRREGGEGRGRYVRVHARVLRLPRVQAAAGLNRASRRQARRVSATREP